MALSVSTSISARTETSITVKWSSNETMKTVKYSYKPDGGSYSPEVTKSVSAKSGSFTITGLSASTNYTIGINISNSSGGVSQTKTATTYAWPTVAECPTFSAYKDVLSLSWYNPLDRELTIAIKYGNETIDTTTNVVGTLSFSAGFFRELLLPKIPNSYSGTYTVTVTYSGHTTSKSGTFTSEGANPFISSISYADSNSTAQAIIGDTSKILQSVSTAVFTINADAAENATVTQRKVTILGTAKTSSTSTVSYGTINSASDVSATITVTDSRGNTTTTTKTVSIIRYESPSALITMNRQNNYYSETNLTVDASVMNIGTNTETITAKYRETGTSTWYNWAGQSTLTDNTQYMQSLDNTKTWDVQIAVKDSFNVTTTYNRTVEVGMPILYIDRGKRSISMNSFPTEDAQFVVNGVDIMHELFYRAGDTFTLTGYTPIHGFVTLGNKLVRLTIPMPKSLANISTITCTACTGGIRVTAGGYLNNGSDSSNWLSDSTVTVTAYKAGDKLIRLELSTSGTYSNVTNNTPVIMACNPVTLSFS